ncbi:hypothetical protein BpHYR1_029072 [Brachionus plicatilis]|uniref:Uncharacterized protein n=1 Tax=Brachionus plicatilis TaxID=10195 RepID=A0A3M7PKR8_BRAPC|nr:hypothetical protein BpHYR1_029072 [Brachionus plicatilis]
MTFSWVSMTTRSMRVLALKMEKTWPSFPITCCSSFFRFTLLLVCCRLAGSSSRVTFSWDMQFKLVAEAELVGTAGEDDTNGLSEEL